MHEPAEAIEVVPIAVQLLRHACQSLDEGALEAKQEIQRALGLLLDSAVSARAGQPFRGLAPWQARRVIDHILAHLDMPVRVVDMAGLTHLSTSHFHRAFKLFFKTPPHAYVISLRLARAREMMLGSHASMSEIALTCGFADQAHFSRVFRREIGCPPGRWRRERRPSRTRRAATAATRPDR